LPAREPWLVECIADRKEECMTTMRTWILVAAGVAVSSASPADTRPGDSAPGPSLRVLVDGWPDSPRQAAEKLVVKYGLPNEATPSMLIWNDVKRGPWKRIVVYRYETPHLFPVAHTDFVEHVIDYRVPVERIGELAAFDGSISVDRTRGEVSARCNDERMNFVALNLVHAIVIGRLSVDEARKQFLDAMNVLEAINGYDARDRPIVSEKLLFKPGQPGEMADPDQPVIETPHVHTELPQEL
jgi:hypothetical protein